ncbi:MAG: hypothetical protein F6K09_00045 [Merismopedia sp. SIO2A8]|nr:hypothetical protein [Merismopedia sp. SIO2A8]
MQTASPIEQWQSCRQERVNRQIVSVVFSGEAIAMAEDRSLTLALQQQNQNSKR